MIIQLHDSEVVLVISVLVDLSTSLISLLSQRRCSALQVLSCNLTALFLLFATALSEPRVPIWPSRFALTAVQNRTGNLALTSLYYDWARGGNLLVMDSQEGSRLWDMEWTNGTSFFFDREVTRNLSSQV